MRVRKGMIHKDGAVEYGCGNRGVAVKVVPVRLRFTLPFPTNFY